MQNKFVWHYLLKMAKTGCAVIIMSICIESTFVSCLMLHLKSLSLQEQFYIIDIMDNCCFWVP